MITNFFIPELNNHDVQELWFQQDGAACHTARATIDLLKDTFDKAQTLDHLEDNIRRVIADIRPQMLEKVIENYTSRLDYIRTSRGSPMPEIIFKMIPLTANYPRLRLQWAHGYRAWQVDWHQVVLSDGPSFNLWDHDDRIHVRRYASEHYLPECFIERHSGLTHGRMI
ncbi:transposable element Tcb1 transposase [Trichonephila clavipes]|nr:transposable element Tcb1 transposase [Trichonephila clavipes]